MAAASYVYRRQGRIADAIRKQEEALDHDPRNTRFVANQAANYMMVRRYADAERAGRRALALDPGHVTAHVWLRYAILSRTGDPARALTVLRGRHPFVEMERGGLLRWQPRRGLALS